MASANGAGSAFSTMGAVPVKSVEPNGLTSDAAKIRLDKDGPNAMPDTSAHPLRNALIKFWAPVPWLLEAAILLQVGLHTGSGCWRSGRDTVAWLHRAERSAAPRLRFPHL